MIEFDLIIKNGFIVLEKEIRKMDIGIRNGKISAIQDCVEGTAKREIDALNQYIFPGVIDVHAHFSEPGREFWEGFSTGSQMMAAGGCTTYFDMPLNGIPSTINKKALLDKASIGEVKSCVDFGLWGGLVPGNVENLKELAELGVVGFKAFLSETGNEEFQNVDDLTLLYGMQEISKLGKVLALHAESAPITSWLQNRKIKFGQLSADDYLASRPAIAEFEAVNRAIAYAQITNCPLHFVHISSPDAVLAIQKAKLNGMDITLETCPHYLLFNHDDLIEKGAIAKCAPPLREEEVKQQLVSLFVEGKFDMISSDHSPCTPDMKDSKMHNIFTAWGGISGGQFTLLSTIELVLQNNMSLLQVAKYTSTNPAHRFKLKGKGKIEVEKDADLVIVSMEPFKVDESELFSKHKLSIYVGHTFPCRIKQTIARGNVLFENGQINLGTRGEWLSIKALIDAV
ncbi:allantoinase AllB [Lysinibacillus telephonicus]|uniref:Allantoinase n=1 Tax=Lysinibacillus telephonicus TaxID=1714840 RepID=A0A3S0IXH6_9BACI|nr:allantoinase AllB [Lysinibacillus telephonicus]RTQ89251.1 allantoinase AllB [Lysinibacillus telephonicus]